MNRKEHYDYTPEQYLEALKHNIDVGLPASVVADLLGYTTVYVYALVAGKKLKSISVRRNQRNHVIVTLRSLLDFIEENKKQVDIYLPQIERILLSTAEQQATINYGDLLENLVPTMCPRRADHRKIVNNGLEQLVKYSIETPYFLNAVIVLKKTQEPPNHFFVIVNTAIKGAKDLDEPAKIAFWKQELRAVHKHFKS